MRKHIIFLTILTLGFVSQTSYSHAQVGSVVRAKTGMYTAENHKINEAVLEKEQLKQNVKVNRMLDKLTEIQEKEVLEAEEENQKSRTAWNSLPKKKE
ncbi:MAG: hypothetical protein GC137_10800 [Alphaproteobacteria bacterium]|nr:hypothetical protein [Alphaproteobacteria bacterium]